MVIESSQNSEFETNNYIGILGLICLTRRFFVSWVLTVLKFIPIIGEFYLAIYYVFIGIIILLAIPKHRYKTRLADIMLLAFCIISWVISSFYVANGEFLQEGGPIFWIQVLPYYYIAKRFDFNSEVSILGIKKTGFNWLYVLSIIGVAVNTLYYIYFIRSGREVLENSSASTNTLICVCYLIFYAFFNRNFLATIFSCVGSFAIIAYGVRTNMVVIIIMLISMILLNVKNSKFKVGMIATITILAGIVYTKFEEIIVLLESMFLKMGINNRFFNLFHSEGIGYLSGRENVWGLVIEKIQLRPILGYGIFGDRPFFNDFNGYAHNFLLEFWVDYGVIIGSILVLIILWLLIKGFIVTKDKYYNRGLIISLACAELVMLLTGGSYLVEGPLFFMIGFTVRCIRESREEILYNG